MPPSPTYKDLTRASSVAVPLAALAAVLVHYFDTGDNGSVRSHGALSALSGGHTVPDILFIGGGGICDYFEAAQIRSLYVYIDPDLGLLPALQVPGLPTSLPLDRGGRIVARLYGAHSWGRRPPFDVPERYVARSLAAGDG